MVRKTEPLWLFYSPSPQGQTAWGVGGVYTLGELLSCVHARNARAHASA